MTANRLLDNLSHRTTRYEDSKLVQTPSFYQSEDEVHHEFITSAKTAISRRGPSAPPKQIANEYAHLLREGSTLNLGKGRDQWDSDLLINHTGHCNDYDFSYCPDVSVLTGSYKTIYAGFVVNVLTPSARHKLWTTLANLSCRKDGLVIVAARSNTDRGIKGVREFDGYRVRKLGSFQKGYFLSELESEAKQYFRYSKEISTRGTFRIAICSNAAEIPV